MGRTVDLLAACEAGDEVRVEQLGWRGVMTALRFWPRRVDVADLEPYVLLLGDEEPDRIVEALRALATDERYAKWRPGPTEVYFAMQGERIHVPHPTNLVERPGVIHQPRIDQTDRAYEAVLGAVAAGITTCHCVPRPVQINVDDHGVLRCPECGGLEPGQVDAAMDAFAPPEHPVPTMADHRCWAAEVQEERIMEGRPRSPLLDRLTRGEDTPWHIFKRMPDVTEDDLEREREILRGYEDTSE